MNTFTPVDRRVFPLVSLEADLVVVGGGMSGFCAALGAARDGASVILVQDRPVLGGNASSEMRLWALGATSHMGNNNRWAREGGIAGEVLEENRYRNKEGNPVMFDLLLLDMARAEPNLTFLLNTTVDAVEKRGRRIVSVAAFNSINQTRYAVSGKYFCDASGDGVVGFLAGAEFRVGAEKRDEFGEGMAPGEEFGQLLGHSIYFTTRRMEEPVRFVPPAFALDDITKIPRYKRLTSKLSGAGDLWWLEWGGNLDTVHDSERIKWELWKVIWGVWNHIKNSGQFADADRLTIDWAGLIPGKRESRRFIGDYILNQKDLIGQIDHPDAIAYGGWSIDLHPAGGVYSELDACVQFHSKGTYTIPYRCYYAKGFDNLFLAGRIISASHVAFGSSRIMLTCALGGEVAGRAAAWCLGKSLTPAALGAAERFAAFRRHLLFSGYHIPRQTLDDPAAGATVSASSTFAVADLKPNGSWFALAERMALMLPVKKGERLPGLEFILRSKGWEEIAVSLLAAAKPFNHTPEPVLTARTVSVEGERTCRVDFDYRADDDRYVFIAFGVNPGVELALTGQALPGIMTVFNSVNPRVAKSARQVDAGDHGVDNFDFWLPRRSPGQILPAFRLHGPLACFSPAYVVGGGMRPERHANAWVPAAGDASPWLELAWKEPREITEAVVVFDGDFDNALETVHMGHHDAVAPHGVTRYRLTLDGSPLAECGDNRLSVRRHAFAPAVAGRRLRLEILATGGSLPAVYAIRVR